MAQFHCYVKRSANGALEAATAETDLENAILIVCCLHVFSYRMIKVRVLTEDLSIFSMSKILRHNLVHSLKLCRWISHENALSQFSGNKIRIVVSKHSSTAIPKDLKIYYSLIVK